MTGVTDHDEREAGPGPRRFVLPTLLVLAVTLLLYGWPVPRLSEELYLPLVRRVADPGYLRGDWTFSGSFGEHWLFDHLFAPVAGVLSVDAFGWLGRLVFWPVLGFLLIRLGTRFGLRVWPAALAVTPVAAEQPGAGRQRVDPRHVRGEDRRLRVLPRRAARDHPTRIPLGLALLGLTVSFHPAVGLWSAWATGLALLVLPDTRAHRAASGAGSRSCSRFRESSVRSPRRGTRPPRCSGSWCSRRSRTTPTRSSAVRRSPAGRWRCTSGSSSPCSRSTSGPTAGRSATSPAVLRRVPDGGRDPVRRWRTPPAPSTSGTTCASCRCGRSRSWCRLIFFFQAFRFARSLATTNGASRRGRRRGRRDADARPRRHALDRDPPDRAVARRAPDDPAELRRVDHRRPRRPGVRLGAGEHARGRALHRPGRPPGRLRPDRARRDRELAGDPVRPAVRVEAPDRRSRRRRRVLLGIGLARRPAHPACRVRPADDRAGRRAGFEVPRPLPRHRDAVPVPAPPPATARSTSTRSNRSDRPDPIRRLGGRASLCPIAASATS